MTAFLQCAQSVHCVRPGMDIVKSYHVQQEEEVHAHYRQHWYVKWWQTSEEAHGGDDLQDISSHSRALLHKLCEDEAGTKP